MAVEKDALTALELQALQQLADWRGQWVSAQAVAAAANMHRTAAWGVLRRMRMRGLVTWCTDPAPGSGRSVLYRITPLGVQAATSQEAA